MDGDPDDAVLHLHLVICLYNPYSVGAILLCFSAFELGKREELISYFPLT
jgi:hypothetical protein